MRTMKRRILMTKTDASFTIRGRVGKGIYHNNKGGNEITSFNLGVIKGKAPNGQGYDWESIPVLGFGNFAVETGEYVVVFGRIGVSRKNNQSNPILLCDAVAKIADTRVDRPMTANEKSDNFYGNNNDSNDNFSSDSDIPF